MPGGSHIALDAGHGRGHLNGRLYASVVFLISPPDHNPILIGQAQSHH